jgi:hypothetical protein
MSHEIMPLNHDALSDILKDQVIIRIVKVLNLAKLSILELVEHGFTQSEINRALAKGIVEFDKPVTQFDPEIITKSKTERVLDTGDYYFQMLNGKVRLTKLGLYILDITEEDIQLAIDAS